MFSGLQALDRNLDWNRLVHNAMHSIGLFRDECVAKTMSDLQSKMPDVAESKLDFTQYSVCGRGHEGTNACVAIAGSVMCPFLFDEMPIEQCFEPQRLRRICEQQVQAWALILEGVICPKRTLREHIKFCQAEKKMISHGIMLVRLKCFSNIHAPPSTADYLRLVVLLFCVSFPNRRS